MRLAPGVCLGPYEITALIGAGGMGEVYRARDTKLHRDVALKVLPDSFAADPERVARFQREAQVLAALDHQNIAGIHGLEDAAHVKALVLELVEGPTLADRLARGPIPPEEALPIARQIAEALEAAHETGIIHRDLKPANIKLRPDGRVKILDFGLAKALEPAGHSAAGAGMNAPTITSPAMTVQGVILGTAAYMAPEQAKGRAADRRADIWAFGIVLFEMLTGRPAYAAETVSETLAHVLTKEPDWASLPSGIPPRIRELLRRCLHKDPRLRLQAIGEARIALDERIEPPIAGGATSSPAGAPLAGRRGVLAAAAALALAATGVALAWTQLARTVAEPGPVSRFTIMLPEPDILPRNRGNLLALSPDGGTLVYRASRDGQLRLFRRALDRFEATAIPGVPDGAEAFLSADAGWIAFGLDRILRKVPLSGGEPQSVTPLTHQLRGGTWTSDGRIIFGLQYDGRLMQVPTSGGEATALFKASDVRSAWYPQLLPDTQTVLFTLSEAMPDTGELHLLELKSGEHRTLLPDAVAGRVLDSGHLVFVRNGSLWAVPFDRRRLEVRGDPVPVVEGVRVERNGGVQVAIAENGSLAYLPGTAGDTRARELLVLERDGRSSRLAAPAREYVSLALSPDQSRMAVQIGLGDEADVWVADLVRGTLTRITAEAGFDGHPLWSPDGRSLVFASTRGGRSQLHRKRADGTGRSEMLASFEQGVVQPYAWTADREALLFDLNKSRREWEIGILPVDGSGQWKSLISGGEVYEPNLSPDGRWIAYSSRESGQDEVYVQRFPDLGERRVASVGEAYMPRWAADGRALYYIRGANNAVMRVSFDAREEKPVIGTPEVFQPFSYFSMPNPYRLYDVSSDGERLFVIGYAGSAHTVPERQINVVLNWMEELKRLVPIP